MNRENGQREAKFAGNGQRRPMVLEMCKVSTDHLESNDQLVQVGGTGTASGCNEDEHDTDDNVFVFFGALPHVAGVMYKFGEDRSLPELWPLAKVELSLNPIVDAEQGTECHDEDAEDDMPLFHLLQTANDTAKCNVGKYGTVDAVEKGKRKRSEHRVGRRRLKILGAHTYSPLHHFTTF